jgi:tetratricopeptide (TPR) repeat protein
VQTFLQIAIPLADAVAAAHARGITHRDLKPANVMMTTDGRLKVLDFGLAKLAETSGGLIDVAPTEFLTGTGQILGTVAYMSSEQAEGKTVDHRTDLFSLGIMLYELATGERPFKGDSNASVLSSILRDTPPPVSDLNAGIPRPIARLISRCLEKTPSDRLQSALDLKHELEDLRTDATSNISASSAAGDRPQASVAPRQRSWIKSLALVVLALALGAGAYGVWTRWRPVSATSEDASSTASVPVTVKRFENRTGDSKTVLAYRNMGNREGAREALDRMSAMRDRWDPKQQALLEFLVHAHNGRLLDALKALREAEKLDPADLSTNYLIGFYAVRLNRPQEEIDQYSKINADAWDSVTVGTWRYARLATANHLLGRHDEELKVATLARETFPTSFLSRNDELIALAALGRTDDLRRAVDNTLTMATQGVATPAGSMRFAAEELRAHGHRAESIDLARRSVAWYRNRPADFLTSAASRFSLALSLYDAEEWAEAGSIASALIKEQPGSSAYLGLAGAIAARMGDRAAAMKQAAALSRLAPEPDGIVELARAQLAAVLGQRERAVELLRNSFARGLSMSTALHRQMDFESVRGFAPFDELMKPKG